MIRFINSLIILGCLLLLFSCGQEASFTPKPRIYPKVIYPEKTYQDFEASTCPFTLTIPEYFSFIKDSTNSIHNNEFDCWYDLYTDSLNAYIHLSYLSFKDRKEFDKLVNDAFELVDKHNIKASYRDEYQVTTKNKNVTGLVFEIDGPVATPYQFFMTDSTKHFLRGSLYFKAQVNRDSIEPVYKFLKQDVETLIHSLQWKE